MISCQSCQIEIDPKYVAALRQNVCPGCNESIMSDESKVLMDELREVMAKMPNDPDGLAGWLLSNYYLEKIDPDKNIEPAEFHYPRKKRRKPVRQSDSDDEPQTASNYYRQMSRKLLPKGQNQIAQMLQKVGVNEGFSPELVEAVEKLNQGREMSEYYDDDDSSYGDYDGNFSRSQAPRSIDAVKAEYQAMRNKARSALQDGVVDPRTGKSIIRRTS